MIEQLAQASEPVSHAREMYALGGILLIQVGTIVGALMRSRKRAPELGRELDKRLMPIDIKLDSLSGEVQGLKAFVIGPDGQNGIRGELREVKESVKGLLDRERGRRK